ncbi:hypothetical protein M405DRAFT_735836 [Rhizopogon salebrosus TDB-379]|nr:hypothetical protein M405DRAFT_735836 [Rhizopogon salebrosus TDB-379]
MWTWNTQSSSLPTLLPSSSDKTRNRVPPFQTTLQASRSVGHPRSDVEASTSSTEVWTWSTQPRSRAQRRLIELIYDRTGKYANWNPSSEIRVGSYGRIDRETGSLIVIGSIYDDDFKQNLVDAGIDLDSGEHHPEETPDEADFIASSKNVKKVEANLESTAEVPGFDNAFLKGTWEFEKHTTGALLLMHSPRMRYITSDTLGKLSTIRLLRDMHLVTKVFYCPAYFMYLSDKSGEKVSIALLGSAPVPGAQGVTVDGIAPMTWWSNTQPGSSRRGCKTEHCFTPLYDLKHVRHLRHYWRSSPSPERRGEDL